MANKPKKAVAKKATKPQRAKLKLLTAAQKIDLLAQRLHALEHKPALASVPAAPPDFRPVIFSVVGGNAVVRLSKAKDSVSLADPDHPIIPPGGGGGQSKPLPSESYVDFFLELNGSPGDGTEISVENAKPVSIKTGIPADYKGHWFPRIITLKTNW